MTFGERLIDLRKTRKYTREALAEELNISKYTLRNYELSVNEPGSSFLKQVSDFFVKTILQSWKSFMILSDFWSK